MYWLSFGTDTPPAPHPRHLPTDRSTSQSPAPRVPAASSTRTDTCAQLAASPLCSRGLAPCHVPCGGACAPRAWACNICPHAKSPTTCHLPPSTLAPLQAHRGGRHPQRTGDGNDANRCTRWWSTAAVTHVQPSPYIRPPSIRPVAPKKTACPARPCSVASKGARVHTCPVAPKHAHSLSSTLSHSQARSSVRGHGRFFNHFTTDVCL